MTRADAFVAWPGSVEDRQIAMAVCLSLLLHGLVLFGWRHQPALRQAIADGTLVVSFRNQAPAQVEHPETRLSEPESSASERPASVVLASPTSTAAVTPSAVPQRMSVATDLAAQKDEPRLVAPPVPHVGEGAVAATPTRKARRPGEVAIIIIVDHDGRPGQIFWDRLPALTDEQFARLKHAVRSRVYGAVLPGTRVDEVIDVSALLDAVKPGREAANDRTVASP